MSLIDIQKRVKRLENIAFSSDKWRLKLICIQYRGNLDDVNTNKTYWFNYKGKDLNYDNLDYFYNEYNVYPNKDINPQIIEIIDNSHLEKTLYDANIK